MLPNGIAGVGFHHGHRVLYKSLSEHYDYLYKNIGSGGTLNRIVVVRIEFFCRQSVMPFVDRRELFAEAGRWIKSGTCKLKGSIIGGKTAIGRIISLGKPVRYALHLRVVPSALASYLVFVYTHNIHHTS
jgi:hypothetical protein